MFSPHGTARSLHHAQVGPEERALRFTLSSFQVKRQTRIILQFGELISLTLVVEFEGSANSYKIIGHRPLDRSLMGISGIFPGVKQKFCQSLIARTSRRVIRIVRCSALWASHDTGPKRVRVSLVLSFWHISQKKSQDGDRESVFVISF